MFDGQALDNILVKHLANTQHVSNEENHDVQLVGQPTSLSRTPSSMATRLPKFDEHTDETLEFGFDKNEIAELRSRKVV